MPANDPEHRALISRIANATRWANEPDRAAATAKAREGLRERFERQADPDGTLSPQERTYRADRLQQAHMARMSLRAAQARSAKRAARQGGAA